MILNNLNGMMGVKILTPIIDFDCIVDTEYGILQLIYDQYYDLSIFNQKKFEMPSKKILLELYTRKCKNPLIPFLNEGISEEDADEYYAQFMNEKYQDILDRSCGTNMQTVLESFNSSGDIIASIMYHNELQHEYLSKIPEFSSNKIYSEEEFKNSCTKFNQIYFRYVDDASKFADYCKKKTVYFSSSELNMEDSRLYQLKKTEELLKIMKKCYIGIYDLYSIQYLKGEK